MDKTLLGQRIKQRRKELGMTQGDIATSIGVAVSTVQRYESAAIDKIKLPVVEAIARTLQVNPNWLIGKTNRPGEIFELKPPGIAEDVVSFPVITSIAAHYDSISVDESISEDIIDIPLQYLHGRSKENFCVMRVKGDSMYPDFRDGDLVLIKLTNTLDRSGDIGVVTYGDDEMTLKRVRFEPGEDWIELIPINPMYKNKVLTGIDLEYFHVIGVPTLLLREM